MMSKTFKFALLLALALASAGCAKKVDLEASRSALKTADAEWNKSLNNVDSFVTFLMPDGAILPPNEPGVSGTDAVRTWASKMIAMPGFSVTWEASVADVSQSGDLGYTSGAYQLSMQGPAGAPISDHGKYLTVWKKDATGAWKVVLDTFNSDVAMAPVEPAVDPYPDDK
jgi:ketosteroid isomerase-like protein